MFDSYLIYGVPFKPDSKTDWAPIYKFIEPGQYNEDPELFSQEIDDETLKDDIDSFQYCLDGKDLNDNYQLLLHKPSHTFMIVDKNYSQYITKDAFLKVRQPSLIDYQKFIIFFNKNHINVDFETLGIYLLNDYSNESLINSTISTSYNNSNFDSELNLTENEDYLDKIL